MHSGWPFSLHTPFPDRWGFEPDIDYQSLPGRKSGVFTDVYETNNAGAIFAGGAFYPRAVRYLKLAALSTVS